MALIVKNVNFHFFFCIKEPSSSQYFGTSLNAWEEIRKLNIRQIIPILLCKQDGKQDTERLI